MHKLRSAYSRRKGRCGMNPDKPRFLNFPLCLLMKTITDHQTGFNEITAHALRGFSQSFASQASPKAALIQACYVATRQKDKPLPNAIRRILEREDISAFSDSLFESTLEGEFTQTTLESLNDYGIELSESESEALEDWHTMCGAASYFGREIQDFYSIEKQANTAQRTADEHARQSGGLAYCSIGADYYFETRNSYTLETGRRFRMICAVRSLIGSKPWTGTTKDMVRARMIGAKSPVIAEQLTRTNKALKEELEALQSRKRFDRLMDEVASRGFFGKFGKGRRLYLSTEIKDPVKLAAYVAKSFRKKAYQLREKQARDIMGASLGQQQGIIGGIFNKTS